MIRNIFFLLLLMLCKSIKAQNIYSALHLNVDGGSDRLEFGMVDEAGNLAVLLEYARQLDERDNFYYQF